MVLYELPSFRKIQFKLTSRGAFCFGFSCLIVLIFPETTLYGPVHSEQGVNIFKQAVADAKAQGGTVQSGGEVRVSSSFFIKFYKTNTQEIHFAFCTQVIA